MSKKEPRKRTFMVAQELFSNYFDWDSTEDKGRYSDKRIVSMASDFSNSNSKGYSYKSPDHYVYSVYQRYYWRIKNEYRHDFNDYDFIFKNKNLKDKARLVILHVAMRIELFSFLDYRRNGKHSKSSHRKFVPIKLAGILHDSDKSIRGDIVKPHFHMAIKIGKQVTPSQLSKWSGIQPQYFQSTKGGRYAFDNELAYLTHAKQPRKHLYNHNDVWSNKPVFDYQKYYQAHHEKWERRRASVSKQNASGGKDWLEQLVKDGKITFQQMLLNSNLYEIYTTDIQNIKNLFQARADRVAELTRVALKARKFGLSVMYICGPSSSGKTTIADHIVDRIKHKYGWQAYQTIPAHGGNSHPFDNYNGEPIVYWDEARSGDMSASEWLQFLDPRHENSIDARYSPKKLAARVIIITTIDPPEEFFGFMNGIHQDEPLTQFMRRLGIILHVKMVGGKQQFWIDPIVNRTKEQSVYVGDSKTTGDPIYKKSQYVEMPKPKHPVNAKQASDIAVKFIARNNNPKLEHEPGHHETIPMSRPKVRWHLPDHTVTCCDKGDETDNSLSRKYSKELVVANKNDDGSRDYYVKGTLPF